MSLPKISIHRAFFLLVLAALCSMAFASSGNNAVPYIDSPLVPTSIKSGGSGFTLTVNGAGFVSGSVVNWNGSPRATTFVSNAQLTASILATDIAVKGTASITVSSPAPGGGSSNVVFLPVLNQVQTIVMAGQSVSASETAEAVGDFNGDGRLDLATMVLGGSGIEVFLGNGNGTFQTPILVSTDGSCGAGNLVAADFNGDGIVDLAQGCGGAFLLLGNGDGTFQSPISIPLPGVTNVFPVAAGDFNHDGNLDLAVADANSLGTYSGQISIVFGNGDGTFQSATSYPLGTVGDLGMFLTVGDFNNDGQLDLAVASTASNAVAILLNNGVGTFEVLPAITVEAPESLAAAALQPSGKLDLVVGGRSSNVYVLPGNGDGTFGSPVGYGLPTQSMGGLALGDFNGDGALDVAVPTYNSTTQANTISILLGNARGGFRSVINLHTSVLESDTLVAGDFNGDGWLDLAVGSAFGSTSLYLQTPLAAQASPVSLNFAAQVVGTTSSPQQVQLTNTGEMPLRISGIHTKGDFSQTNNCGSSLAVRASCTVSVVFAPTKVGLRKGQLTFGDNASNSPQLVALSGTGTN